MHVMFAHARPSRAEQFLALRDLIRTEDRFLREGCLNTSGFPCDPHDEDAQRFSIWCAARRVAFPKPDPADPYPCLYDLGEELLSDIEQQMGKLGIMGELIPWSRRVGVDLQDVLDVLEVVAEMQNREDIARQARRSHLPHLDLSQAFSCAT